jgi:hypothetical protein
MDELFFFFFYTQEISWLLGFDFLRFCVKDQIKQLTSACVFILIEGGHGLLSKSKQQNCMGFTFCGMLNNEQRNKLGTDTFPISGHMVESEME